MNLERLKVEMKRCGFTQRELARRLFVDPTTLKNGRLNTAQCLEAERILEVPPGSLGPALVTIPPLEERIDAYRLELALGARRMSRKQLADALEAPPDDFTRWISGRESPPRWFVRKAVSVLGLEEGALLAS